MIGTNSSSFMTEDESSINGRVPSLKHRWKSIDKLCGFREPFSLEHKVHPCDGTHSWKIRLHKKSGRYKTAATNRLYSKDHRLSGAYIGTSWTLRKPDGYVSFAFLTAFSCVFFCHSVAAFRGVEGPFFNTSKSHEK